MTVFTEIEGLTDCADYFRSVPDRSRRAARLAINTIVNRAGLNLVKEDMYKQINFPKGYLSGDRLRVSKLAKENDLEAIIVGRKRATSLARFAAPGTPLGSRKGSSVKVTVRNGAARVMRNAWLVRLRQGKSLTEDQYNVGLAVRVKPGDTIGHKKSPHQAWLNAEHTVALLYGPSVDQVFKDVRDDVSPRFLQLIAFEFLRQFDRLA